jgi:NADH dehydrogenase
MIEVPPMKEEIRMYSEEARAGQLFLNHSFRDAGTGSTRQALTRQFVSPGFIDTHYQELEDFDAFTPPSADQSWQLARVPRIVIIGGGFGGLQAALHLGKTPAHVTVIDRNNHHLFQPLLYQVATGILSPSEISAPIRHILGRQENTDVLMAEVTGVNTEHQRVLVRDKLERDHVIPYDYLVIATGTHENYFGHDNWRTIAPGLKTVEDARTILQKMLRVFEEAELENDPQRIRELLTFVIVGGGPTGVELAGDIAEVAHHALKKEFRHINPAMTRIILVDAGPRILATFAPELSHSAHKKLSKLGIEIRNGKRVTDLDEHGVMIGEERIISANVFWTAGVTATPVARWLNAEADRVGRVKVQEDLSVPHHPNIFVIGDVASCVYKGKPLAGIAPVAMQQGRYVARLINNSIRNPRHRQSFPAFRYKDKGNLATVGRGFSILQFGPLKLHGPMAWLLWLGIHIFYLITFQNRLLVLQQWIWTYLTFQRRSRLITTTNVPVLPSTQNQQEVVPKSPLTLEKQPTSVPMRGLFSLGGNSPVSPG